MSNNFSSNPFLPGGKFDVKASDVVQMQPVVEQVMVEEMIEELDVDVILTGYGDKRVDVIKAVRSITGLQLKESLELLKPILESSEILKIAHNINFDLSVLNSAYKNQNIIININNFNFDTLIAANLLGYRNIGLKDLVKEFYDINLEPITSIIGKGKSQISIGDKPINEIAKYAINDAYFTYKLKQKFENELSNNNLNKLFDELEIKLIPILNQMQSDGMPIDLNLLNELQNDFLNKINILESNAKSLIQEEINLNSPQQLSKVLFEKLNLPKTKRTKLGYSTDAQSITDLKNGLTDKFRKSESFNPSFEDNTKIQFLN